MDFSRVFVYLRFSSDAQADGLSFERQRAAAHQHIQRLKTPNIAVEYLEDPGVSAYSGKNMKSGALGRFIQGVRAGDIRDGLFICEAVHRMSRQGSFVLLGLIGELLDAGFWIQFMDDAAPFSKTNKPDMLGTLLALRADLAEYESATKSRFAKANWIKRRSLAEEQKVPFTSECPNWLIVQDGQYVPIADRVAAINTIFRLAADGCGISKLVRYANENKLPAPGKSGTWHTSLVNRVLKNRALIGEFHPHQNVGGKRIKVSERPIDNYYPIVVDAKLFNDVQALRAKAQAFPARRDDNNFNYLLGIAKCACGSSWRRMNKNSGAQEGYALYGCSNRQRGASTCPNIPAKSFDFQFVMFACDVIPGMIRAGSNPIREKIVEAYQRLAEIEKSKANLLDLAQSGTIDLREVVAPRIEGLLKAERDIKDEISQLELDEPPQVGFEFGDATSIFIPAFLDVHPRGSEAAESALRVRNIFRARILESVKSVLVASDRKSFTVMLKNGQAASIELEEIEFGRASKYLLDEEMSELEKRRSQSMAKAGRISNT